MESISHPEWLAFELYSQDTISIKLYDETMKITGPSTYCRASKLVAAVKDRIMVNSSVLHKFLSVVRRDPSLVYIADAMSDSYRKYNGELLHNYVFVMLQLLSCGKVQCEVHVAVPDRNRILFGRVFQAHHQI